ncbi:MAG: coproporphyrinogen III oxidase, partial [Erysipelotrichaceae bacterium]|nr:coproporphyrinogen III oxidase [Erysipelotrichaceae bacterium]
MMTRIKHLYVHVPFCKSICYYCDFCHCIYDESIAKQWLERLKKEIEETCLDQYETIYIGGGTPTALSCEQ